MVGIYKITSPTGRIYIGQSRNIESRFSSYRRVGCKTQTRLYNSLKKHGADNHAMEVLVQCDLSELDNLETYYINLYDTFNTEHGLNLCTGGGAYRVVSDETKKKMSTVFTGELNPFFGKKHSDKTIPKLKGRIVSEATKIKLSNSKMNISNETRVKMSLSQRNKSAPSIEVRQKMSKSQRGRKHNELTKQRISIGNSKRIIQYDNYGNVISEYKSISEAALITGIKRTTISGCVNGYCSTSKGFVWKKIIELK